MQINRSYFTVSTDSINDRMVTYVLASQLQDQIEADADTVAEEKSHIFHLNKVIKLSTSNSHKLRI